MKFLVFTFGCCLFVFGCRYETDKDYQNHSIVNSLNPDSIQAEYERKFAKDGYVNVGEMSKKMFLTDTNNSEYAVQYATCLMIGGKSANALSICDNIIKKKPDFSQAYWIKGEILRSQNRDSGYYYFEKAISKNPNWYYYFQRSRYYDKDTMHPKALLDIGEAIKQRPKDPDLKLFRGKYKSFNKDYKGALVDLEYIPPHRVNDPEIYYIKGYTYYFLKDYEKAIKYCNKSLSIDSTLSDPWFLRAAIKKSLHQDTEAFEYLKKCAELGNKECAHLYYQADSALKTKKNS